MDLRAAKRLTNLERVRKLYDQGLSADVIATRTGLSQSQVYARITDIKRERGL